jgi:hypothetical protein
MSKFLNNIDLQKNELRNAKVHALATDPSSPVAGQIYFNTADGRLKIYDGAAWRYASGLFSNADISGTAAIALSKLATDPLARANHTGTQTASTISDFDTQVRSSRLDQMALSATNVDLNSQRITGLADPVNAQDAATKSYVDAFAVGLDPKPSVRVATTASITLSSTQTIDGVSLSVGNRVLVKDQSTASENGIYVVSASAWSRSSDANTDAEVTAGLFTFVEEGTAHANSGWVLATDNPITVGTTDLSFVQFSGAGQIEAGDGLTKTGNRLDVVGTAGRVSVSANAVDIATGYVGQTTITTLGTVTTGTWNGTPVAVAYGGTGATDAAGAKTNLSFITRYATDIGDGTSTDIVITHNLNTRDAVIQVREAGSPYEQVNVDVEYTTANTATLRFAAAPTSNSYRAIVMG